MNKRFLSVLLVVALAIFAFVNFRKRVELASELKKLSVQMEQLQGNNPQAAAEAKAIVERVKKHISILGDVEPTVATIVDVETLRARNEFYKNAKNGDHLVITPTRAILYNPDTDRVIDVVPVQLEPNVPPAEQPKKK